MAIAAVSDRLALTAQRTVKARRNVEGVAIRLRRHPHRSGGGGLTTMRQGHFAKGEPRAQAALDGIVPQFMPVQLAVLEI